MITLPPLGEAPPIDPPDPAIDPHAYNMWFARWANYKWLLGQYTHRECVEAQAAIGQAIGNGLADILDQYDRQHRRAMFFEFARTFQIRAGDTDASLPKTIKAAFDRLLAELEPTVGPGT